MCFTDYTKAFDCVDREHVDHLEGHGVPTQLMVLLRNMYANQEAAVKTALGDTAEFDIGEGVRKGFIMFHLLFNIYAEQ